jgi:cellulose synthase/poly-beta-1,6-N-acetylglucosamine synthase-like glycosyltransferase
MTSRLQLSRAMSTLNNAPVAGARMTTEAEETGKSHRDRLPPYVLITPARNEEAFIQKTLDSVVAQTHRPLRWVIVDDGSTDRTPEIVETYVGRHPWIELVRRLPRKDRNFAGKVYAFNDGLGRIRDPHVGLIGNLDADVSFGSDHFEFLTKKFFGRSATGRCGNGLHPGRLGLDARQLRGASFRTWCLPTIQVPMFSGYRGLPTKPGRRN